MGILLLLIGLIVCVIPIVIVILIISAIVKRNKEDKNNFGEIVRNIYIYIILIVTLVAIISGVIATFKMGLDIILPEKSVYENSYDNEELEKNENIIELFTTISLVLSTLPVFIYHNKLARKSKEIKNQEINN